jgi:hypothetical protein
MGVSAQRKFASRVEFMESIGFRYVVLKTSKLWELREYVDQRPVVIRIGLRSDPVGNLLQIKPAEKGWVLGSVSMSAPARDPFEHALDAFDWWVASQK